MKARYILIFWLAFTLTACKRTGRTTLVDPAADQVLRQMALYYENLNGFQGTNTIINESHSVRPLYANDLMFANNTREKAFAFLRPNKFNVTSQYSDEDRLFCDGVHLWDYRPYYYNSFTVAPAPACFEDAGLIRAGGEILYMMLMTNRLEYLTNGLGLGKVPLKYVGKETVGSVLCHHLCAEETISNIAELWIAGGTLPCIVKYVSRSPKSWKLGGGTFVHTEVITGWRANDVIPLQSFIFVPPPGSIERPLGAEQVESTSHLTNGVWSEAIKFVASNEDDAIKTFLNVNQGRFQAISLKSVLEKYPGLKTNDLAFVDIRPTREKTFVVTFAFPKTQETTNVDHSIQTKVQTIVVTLSQDGSVKHIGKGSTLTVQSLNEKTK